MHHPYTPYWVISLVGHEDGEKFFKLAPYKRGAQGLWFFQDYVDAKGMIRDLEKKLKGDVFLYRDGDKSKEEILKTNLKAEQFAKEVRFPNENLIIMGEGRTMGEKSFVLVRGGHVYGFGYSLASEEEIEANPESFITRRFFHNLGVDLTTKRYIRELKNMRQKSDGWRSLAEMR